MTSGKRAFLKGSAAVIFVKTIESLVEKAFEKLDVGSYTRPIAKALVDAKACSEERGRMDNPRGEAVERSTTPYKTALEQSSEHQSGAPAPKMA
ncbi:MAG: hypothetical protein K0R66_640 [Gammaproteobacteria bacterium]|jgi:hypothetical protein|nr:hypothetical protein [Gammaproteobacteria bacterium]